MLIKQKGIQVKSTFIVAKLAVEFYVHRSEWTLVVEEMLTYGNRLRSTHCMQGFHIRQQAGLLNFDLLEYYKSAMQRGANVNWEVYKRIAR